MRHLSQPIVRTLALLLAISPMACDDDDKKDSGGGGEGVVGAVDEPELGTTDFVSADGVQGQQAGDERAAGGGSDGGDLDMGAPSAEGDEAGGGDNGATVEEGDIYRVLGDGLLLNLNSYRGLQVIDISNPAAPAIVGRSQVTGQPVELYALGDRAIVLVNHWQGYYGVEGAMLPQQYNGGLVLDVDISDPTAPRVLGRAQVPGTIRKSRLVRQGDAAALYVVANEIGNFEGDEGEWEWRNTTVAKSFRLGGGALEARSQVDLGGFVVDIQATPEVLMVARTDWQQNDGRSAVALIDISSPEGDMVEGGEILARGTINNQFNMDLHEGILRVVSDGRRRGENDGNHVETFDATDLQHPEAIDHVLFGENENLFATLFLGNKAFFVTFRRTDPFHAFEIDDDGNITERAEFIVSGWNDFFRPALDATRLIGIGVGDDRGNAQSVSLYDITDLDNAEPLVARQAVDADHSWSEARYDHRAFSVLDGAVEIDGPDGGLETGMVLLPFSGWDRDDEVYRSGVQIFTYGADSLTRRAVMEHGTPVRRSFETTPGQAGNLSEEDLSIFDTADPDAPAELGRVELAPAYSDFLPFGDVGVRLKDTTARWAWWNDRGRVAQPPALIEVVELAGDPDSVDAVATIEAPAGATLHRVDEALLAVVTSRYQSKEQSPDGPTLETVITVYDLSDGAAPAEMGTLTTTEIPESYERGRPSYGPSGGLEPDISGGMVADGDMMEGGHYWYGAVQADVRVAGDALVFVERRPQQLLLGVQHDCSVRPDHRANAPCQDEGVVGEAEDREGGVPADGGSADGSSDPEMQEPDEPAEEEPAEEEPAEEEPAEEEPGDRDGEPDREFDGDQVGEECIRFRGSIHCRSLDDGPQTCQGQIQRCVTIHGDGPCEDVDAEDVQTVEECWEHELYRRWSSFALHVVDLSDLAAPALRPTVELDDQREAVSLLADGASVYATWKTPAEVNGDARPFVRYHFTRVDLSNPAEPERFEAVNIPGELLAIEGDALFTRDLVFGEEVVETAVNRLTLTPRGARLDARRRFEDQRVDHVALDGRGRLLVSHRRAWRHRGEEDVMMDGGTGGGGGVPKAPPATTGAGTSTSSGESDDGGEDDAEDAPADDDAPAEEDAPPPPESKKSFLEDDGQHLSVLDAGPEGGMAVLSETPIADWAQLRKAEAGKALFTVGGGLLVVDLADPAAPRAQAYFPTRGWPQRIHVDGDQAYVPAGKFGVYRFSLDVRNLIALR